MLGNSLLNIAVSFSDALNTMFGFIDSSTAELRFLLSLPMFVSAPPWILLALGISIGTLSQLSPNVSSPLSIKSERPDYLFRLF